MHETKLALWITRVNWSDEWYGQKEESTFYRFVLLNGNIYVFKLKDYVNFS